MHTLFYDVDIVVEVFMFQYKTVASREFFSCADIQLTKLFIDETGLKPCNELSLVISTAQTDKPLFEDLLNESGILIRKLNISIYVNKDWFPITIAWKSKSQNRAYKLSDIDIDCDDIEFSFEHLDTALYYKQFYRPEKLPFKIPDLSYELVVQAINLDCEVVIDVKSGASEERLSDEINYFIMSFNDKSEKMNRINGVVHNYIARVVSEEKVQVNIDLGSAGINFVKKFLSYLSKLGTCEKVTIL